VGLRNLCCTFIVALSEKMTDHRFDGWITKLGTCLDIIAINRLSTADTLLPIYTYTCT